MQLTPQQRADVDRQKSQAPGARHVFFKATPQQAAELDVKAEEIEADRAGIEAHYRKLVSASAEPGFSGWLRRRIRQDGRPIRKIAETAHIDLDDLTAFRVGDATLPTDAVDRLVETLGLTLVEEPGA
jgi:hypothetical protein